MFPNRYTFWLELHATCITSSSTVRLLDAQRTSHPETSQNIHTEAYRPAARKIPLNKQRDKSLCLILPRGYITSTPRSAERMT
jgi:hypothetical protein